MNVENQVTNWNKTVSYYFLTFIFLFNLNVNAQKVLTYEDYQKLVISNHPIIKQANLLNDLSVQEVRLAKGGFDPKFDFDFTSKTYGGTKYYEYLDYGLKIPTWYGVDVKMGYENNTGKNINPFEYTPKGGLIFAGIEAPINNILFDERRQQVRTAQNVKQLNDAERVKLVNKSILTAQKDYWEWFFAYYKCTIKLQNLELAKTTYEATIGKIIGGDMATIDSVEAKVNLLERTIEYKDAVNELVNSQLNLSLNLWTDQNQPLELDDNTIPEPFNTVVSLPDTSIQTLYNKALANQPDLLKINLKINKLYIDQKLYNQLYFPQATVIAKYLNSPTSFGTEDLNFNYLSNHFKFGVHLVQPIFLRKDRAKLQLSKIKIQQTKFEQTYTQKSLENSIKQSVNEITNYQNIFNMQNQMYQAAAKLYEGEKSKFEVGEATLFYLNVRQTKMLDSQIKTINYYCKFQKAIAQLNWLCGVYK